MPDAPPLAGLLLWDLVFSLGGSLGQGQGWQSEVGCTRLLGEAGSPSPSAAFQPRVRRSTADSPQRGREPGQHFFLGEEGADVLATAVLGKSPGTRTSAANLPRKRSAILTLTLEKE